MRLTKIVLAIVLLASPIMFSACSRSATSSDGTGTNTAGPAASPKTGFEVDLEYVRKGQYTYIWVFSRQDGKPIDKDDAAYLRTNAPQVVDWVSSEQGKKVIAGTNFDLARGNLELLKKRFVVEDYTGK